MMVLWVNTGSSDAEQSGMVDASTPTAESVAGEAISPDTDHASSHVGDAMESVDGMFAPLAGNGAIGRVVFSTQQSAEAPPQHQPGAGQSKWSRIDVWQQKI